MNSIIKCPLIKACELLEQLPPSLVAKKTVEAARLQANAILQGHDDRLLVIVGPCSIHDPLTALEYAHLLQQAAKRFENDLCIIMRVYFEKPRSTLGWKGLINDPYLNNSFDINNGLRLARQLLLDLNAQAMPAATEFLDVIIPSYLADLIAWSAIGARTSASQLHRELASGLNMPVGFKNNLDGNISIAIDAVKVAMHSHHYLSLNPQGLPVVIQTYGNPSCHIVLRGSQQNSNYSAADIEHAIDELQQANLTPHLMIDCSHGNSMKNYLLQKKAATAIAEQIQQGSHSIVGVMLESYLLSGKQAWNSGMVLEHGKSITDECLSWKETLPLLEQFAHAVNLRRRLR